MANWKLWDDLEATVLSDAGASDQALRRRVADNVRAMTVGDRTVPDGLPGPLLKLVQKMALDAWEVTDEDVQAVLAAGISEEELYELIVTGAVVAGSQRLEIALAALDEVDP